MCQYHLRPSKKTKNVFFYIFCVSPRHLETIHNLIPGWTTNVELLKQVKNWQSPSRDPWSNCLINSREDDKGQTKYYSGRQKDNSKTICGPPGYESTNDHQSALIAQVGYSACTRNSILFAVIPASIPKARVSTFDGRMTRNSSSIRNQRNRRKHADTGLGEGRFGFGSVVTLSQTPKTGLRFGAPHTRNLFGVRVCPLPSSQLKRIKRVKKKM